MESYICSQCRRLVQDADDPNHRCSNSGESVEPKTSPTTEERGTSSYYTPLGGWPIG